jgi:hypothetical protein
MSEDPLVKGVFQSLVDINVGNGKLVFFWIDKWIGGRAVFEIAPGLEAYVPTRHKNRRTVEEALRGSAWLDDCDPNLNAECRVECMRLWEEIENFQRDDTAPDRFTWRGAMAGKYNAKDTYVMLCQGGVRCEMEKLIWKSFAPLKCKIFIWLAIRNRLWTSDRRVRHGLQVDSEACFTCLQEEDTVDHILSKCPYARLVWFRCMRRLGVQIEEPQGDTDLKRWWVEARKRVKRRDRRSFDTLVILVSWMLWKQRNARAFGNVRLQKSEVELTSAILEELRLWAFARVRVRRVIARE